MKLTPIDIRHKEFRRAMRGYSEEEVDIFLDEVADEFERLFQANIELQDRVVRLEEQVAQFDSLKETLQKTLISAQQQADEMRANARKEAELTLRDSELKARDIIADSYAEKQKVQQSLLQLRQVEEDFRFKFRSLLQAHLNLLKEDEESGDRSAFGQVVSGVESELSVETSGPEPAGAGPGWGSLPVQTPPWSGPKSADDMALGVGASEQVGGAAQPSDAESLAAQPPVFARDAIGGAATEEVTAETPLTDDDAMEREFLGHQEDIPAESSSLPPAGKTPQADVPGADGSLGKRDQGASGTESGASDLEASRGSAESRAVPGAAGIQPLSPDYEPKKRESSVRHFLFGGKSEDNEEQPAKDDDRDFQW